MGNKSCATMCHGGMLPVRRPGQPVTDTTFFVSQNDLKANAELRSLVKGGVVLVEDEKVDFDALRRLLKFQESDFVVPDNNEMGTFWAADIYCGHVFGVPSYLEFVDNQLFPEGFPDDLLLVCFDIAMRYNLPWTKRICLQALDHNLVYLLDTGEFLNLSKGAVHELVQRESLEIEELRLFIRLIQWVTHTKADADGALHLFKYVRHTVFTQKDIDERLVPLLKHHQLLLVAEQSLNASRDLELPLRVHQRLMFNTFAQTLSRILSQQIPEGLEIEDGYLQPRSSPNTTTSTVPGDESDDSEFHRLT